MNENEITILRNVRRLLDSLLGVDAIIATAQPTGPAWTCPIHHESRVVPAGISKKTGNPYEAFVVCAEQTCEQRPPRKARANGAQGTNPIADLP